MARVPNNADRRKRILDNAMALVLRYGYSRVTMDDIAKETGMSRPALYQFFRNKSDIVRGVADDMTAQTLERFEQILNSSGTAQSQISTAIKSCILDMKSELESTPHGSELLDISSDLCGEIVDQWLAAIAQLLSKKYAEVIASENGDGAALGTQLLDYLEGMKQREKDPEERYRLLDAFLDMQFAAIEFVQR